jgi:hypothetical protein
VAPEIDLHLLPLELAMSTRAIVWFQNNDSDANEHGTFVYTHDGGDPRFVIQDLKEAHDRARTPRPSKIHPDSYYDDSWKLGRSGYSASLLCGVDPPNFQADTYWLTSGGQFYADLEWIYIVTAEVGDRQWTWFVEVRVPEAEYSYRPILENTRVRHRRQPIEKLARLYVKRTKRRRQAIAAGGGP